DLVLAAQAFHWFDAARFRAESLRIVRPGGWAALIWNDRDLASTPFLASYEALLVEHGHDYPLIRYRHQGTDAIPVYFGGHAPAPVEFPHGRRMDWSALVALANSASYLPAAGQAGHAELMAALLRLFDAHSVDGSIEMRYTCRVHAAPMAAAPRRTVASLSRRARGRGDGRGAGELALRPRHRAGRARPAVAPQRPLERALAPRDGPALRGEGSGRRQRPRPVDAWHGRPCG